MSCVKIGSYAESKYSKKFCQASKTENYLRGKFLTKESPSHRLMLIYYGLDAVEVWDLSTGKLGSIIDVSNVQVEQLFVSPDEKWIGILGVHKELILYNHIKKQMIGTFFFMDNDSRPTALILENGFYKVDKEISKELSFTVNNKNYDFDQWDIRYNRPDQVLEALESSDSSLINSYYVAHTERLKRIGINNPEPESNLQVPELEIVGKQTDGGVTTQSWIDISVHAFEKNKAGRIQLIYVTNNGNPVFGQNGVGFFSNKPRDTIISLRVDLAPGINTIKISTMNNSGTESARQELAVYYEPKGNYKSQTWFIGVGVHRYKNERDSLSFPVKSINELNDFFSRRVPSGAMHSILLPDKMATRDNIKALKATLLKETKPGDKIIFALSGHGTLTNKKDFYFATWDMDFLDKSKYGLGYDDIQWLLDSIPAQNKLILIDACRSGEADVNSAEGKSSAGFELMQEIYTNLNRGNGASIIAAAAGDKDAYEPQRLGNSVFMHFVIEGLVEGLADINGDENITVSELRDFVNKGVREYTTDAQRPVSRIFNFENDWIVARVRH
jgi:hypothetical protein